MAYEFQPFPSFRYHRDGSNCIVKSQEELDGLMASDAGWADTPAAFENDAAILPGEPAPPKTKRKR